MRKLSPRGRLAYARGSSCWARAGMQASARARAAAAERNGFKLLPGVLAIAWYPVYQQTLISRACPGSWPKVSSIAKAIISRRHALTRKVKGRIDDSRCIRLSPARYARRGLEAAEKARRRGEGALGGDEPPAHAQAAPRVLRPSGRHQPHSGAGLHQGREGDAA